MFALSVVCSRGGSGETSKTRQCVGLAIQRSLIRVHKSLFFLPFSAPHLANKFAYRNMGIIFF